ncbi:MAG TPA: HEAT repeat domain-containing protein [Verrucomicrobiae bacterium]
MKVLKIFVITILAVFILMCAFTLVYKVCILDRPDRINKHMVALQNRVMANPPDKEALNELINLTHSSKNSFERTAAIVTLGQLKNRAEPGVDALIDALNENALFSGREAAASLGEICPAARRAIPDLIKAVQKYPDEDTGWFAADSLGHIANSNDTEVVEVLKQAAQSSDERMRFSANKGLQSLNSSH